jgi:type I restriction enzyme, S subunit
MSSSNTKNNKWEYVTLDKVVDKGSSNLSLNKIKDDEGDYPIFSAKGFYKNISFYHQEKEYIAIIKDGAGIGRLSVHPPNSSVVGTMQYLIPKDGFDLMFVKYFLTGVNFIAYKQGATIPHIYFKDYKVELVPKLPLEEQKRIVAKIDTLFAKIDKAISLTEESLKQAKNLLPSVLKEMFEKGKADGWEEKKLQDICEKITDGTHQTPTYFEEGVVFLSSKNVTSGKINWDNVKYIDDAQHQKMHKRVSPKRKDILLAKNGTTGVAAMVDRDVVFDIYVSLAHIRSLGDLIPELLLYYINSPLAKSQFNKRLKGVGVPNLHLREIREVLVVFPNNKEVQLELVKFLDKALNKSKQTQSKLEEQLAYLKQLKSSILSKAFEGEL